jgi:hypothetical protein
MGFPAADLRWNDAAGGRATLWESPTALLGFSEKLSRIDALADLFPARPRQLKQVHSAVIRDAGEPGAFLQGDGWIVRRARLPVVIRTADCLPLFFWSETAQDADSGAGGECKIRPYGCFGGILHVGWRGLQQGIERELLRLPGVMPAARSSWRFLIGPGIEKRCYEVGEDLYQAFAGKPWRDEVFSATGPGRFLLDLKLGLALSLQQAGIPAENIADVGLCTYCLHDRFPSYRRDGKTGRRIYSFLWLK